MTRRLAEQSQGQVRGNRGWVGYVGTWFLTIMMMVSGFLSFGAALALAATGEGSVEKQSSTVLRLSLDEALAIFLQQNQDLLIAKYGIEAAKARTITARLFPNPELSIAGFSAFTQKCTFSDCRAFCPRSVNCLRWPASGGFVWKVLIWGPSRPRRVSKTRFGN